MKTREINHLAQQCGRTLTERGNLELGSDDQGTVGTPGQRAWRASVTYYLLASGDYRAIVDDRYGSNQGRIEWHGGDITRLDGETLDEVATLAREHIESLDESTPLMRAWRIASSEARATLRAATRPDEAPAPDGE